MGPGQMGPTQMEEGQPLEYEVAPLEEVKWPLEEVNLE